MTLYPNVHGSNGHGCQTAERVKMLFNRWMDKEDVSTYTMEYYSAIRKDEYPIFTSTWMGMDKIMLSEISQAEKVNCHMVSLICGA